MCDRSLSTERRAGDPSPPDPDRCRASRSNAEFCRRLLPGRRGRDDAHTPGCAPGRRRRRIGGRMTTTSATRVLVVDDDARVRTLVAWQLEAEGFAVAEAADGPAALEGIAHDRPDLVVLDLSLPGLGGLDVLRRVRTGA